MEHEAEVRVRVFKARNQPIEAMAYKVSDGEIGADMPVEDFIKAVALEYGNVATTMTIKGHEAKLLEAVTAVVAHMKRTTVAVAGINFGKLHKPKALKTEQAP